MEKRGRQSETETEETNDPEKHLTKTLRAFLFDLYIHGEQGESVCSELPLGLKSKDYATGFKPAAHTHTSIIIFAKSIKHTFSPTITQKTEASLAGDPLAVFCSKCRPNPNSRVKLGGCGRAAFTNT